jgi:sugar lactone lactonase YvrE
MLRLQSVLRVLVVGMIALAALAVPAVAHGPKPETLPLPNGFQPEGIATLDRDEVLVGSIPTGALYRVNVKTGTGSLLAPAVEGRSAIGLKVAFGKVFVAGGATGKVRIHDAGDGSVLREEQAGTPGSTFVNDVTVTPRAAYFTDSRAAQIYALPLDGGPLRTIPLTGDFQLVEGNNLNGIAASRSGWLLAVQTATGKLFRIDPATGEAKLVDLGGYVLENGDGLLLEHKLLSVVQNRLNKVAQLKMSRDLLSGRLVRTLTDPDFDVPTTITRAKGSLYAVNARFGTEPTPQTTYAVVRVDGSERHGHRHGHGHGHGHGRSR